MANIRSKLNVRCEWIHFLIWSHHLKVEKLKMHATEEKKIFCNKTDWRWSCGDTGASQHQNECASENGIDEQTRVSAWLHTGSTEISIKRRMQYWVFSHRFWRWVPMCLIIVGSLPPSLTLTISLPLSHAPYDLTLLQDPSMRKYSSLCSKFVDFGIFGWNDEKVIGCK